MRKRVEPDFLAFFCFTTECAKRHCLWFWFGLQILNVEHIWRTCKIIFSLAVRVLLKEKANIHNKTMCKCNEQRVRVCMEKLIATAKSRWMYKRMQPADQIPMYVQLFPRGKFHSSTKFSHCMRTTFCFSRSMKTISQTHFQWNIFRNKVLLLFFV